VSFEEEPTASSKLSLTEEYFLEISKPIYYIADSFQSKVLVMPKLPPKEVLNLSVELKLRSPLAEYGF
jgi:hypothetical protein